jgi:hypothetical protein
LGDDVRRRILMQAFHRTRVANGRVCTGSMVIKVRSCRGGGGFGIDYRKGIDRIKWRRRKYLLKAGWENRP